MVNQPSKLSTHWTYPFGGANSSEFPADLAVGTELPLGRLRVSQELEEGEVVGALVPAGGDHPLRFAFQTQHALGERGAKLRAFFVQGSKFGIMFPARVCRCSSEARLPGLLAVLGQKRKENLSPAEAQEYWGRAKSTQKKPFSKTF